MTAVTSFLTIMSKVKRTWQRRKSKQMHGQSKPSTPTAVIKAPTKKVQKQQTKESNSSTGAGGVKKIPRLPSLYFGKTLSSEFSLTYNTNTDANNAIDGDNNHNSRSVVRWVDREGASDLDKQLPPIPGKEISRKKMIAN